MDLAILLGHRPTVRQQDNPLALVLRVALDPQLDRRVRSRRPSVHADHAALASAREGLLEPKKVNRPWHDGPCYSIGGRAGATSIRRSPCSDTLAGAWQRFLGCW